MLEALGLSPASEAAYLAMLEFTEADVGCLAHRLGLDEARILDALDDLVRMSLLHRSSTDPETVRLVHPEVGLAALIARQHADVARRLQKIEEGRAALLRLLTAHATRQPKTPELEIERLLGVDAILARLRKLVQSCEREACSFIAGSVQWLSSLMSSRGPLADAIERGIRLRAVYLDSVRNSPATQKHPELLAELGGEVRTAPLLPPRMLIVDRQMAVVPMNIDDSGAVALMVSGTGIVTALSALFCVVWKEATPLGTTRRRTAEGLSTQEKQVLVLLGEGHTDEAIARRLGVSVRTARRVAGALLARLGARSRFQAGMLAVARSWIDPADLG